VGTEPHRFFPPFRLDATNAQLWRGNEEIRLRRKTFDVLLYLVDHPGQLVTKAALLDAVWADVSVSDSMPATCVVELRKALGDEARVPQFIETVHGRGYRFIATLKSPASDIPQSLPNGPRAIMVGRRDELTQLQSWYSRVVEGQRQVIFVAGEAGIGKSTFVQAFLDSIVQRGRVRICCGQCVEQYGAGEPYMPVLEGLSRLGQEAGGAGLIELLNRFAPTWLAQMPALLTREERVRLLSEIQGVTTQQRMLREMTQALEALAAEAPLVLFLEDLHWSDFSTLELIAAIARRSELARLLIVGTYRPVEILANEHPLRTMKQELELHRYCEELRLKLLTENDVVDYFAKRVAGDTSPRFGSLAPVVHALTDGNPLFMVNMVDYLLVDPGLLLDSQLSEAEWAETLRAHRLDALRSTRHMIERNLERLKPQEQVMLEAASVVGAEFSSAAVAAALECPQDEVEACCTRLSRCEQFVDEQGPITWPDDTVAAIFRFHHSLYQEVLYGRLPLARRFQFHRRIAMCQEAAYGDHAAEIATELAHHYRCSNSKDKAIHYFRVAGERAVSRGAVIEARDHYRSALELLTELPHTTERDRQELTLQVALGSVLLDSENWSHPETASVFARAEELAKRLGENSQLVSALLGLLISCTGSGRFRLAREVAERMLRVADGNSDPDCLSVAHTFLGETLMEGAQYIDAQKHLELGSRYCDESKSSGLGGWGLIAPALLSNVLLVLGFPDRARAQAKKALQDTTRCAHFHKLGGLRMWLGFFSLMLRDLPGILEHAQSMNVMAVKSPVWSGLADYFASRARMLDGNWREAATYLHKAITFQDSAGLFGVLRFLKFDQVELLANQGSINEAFGLVSKAIKDQELPHLWSPSLRQRADLLVQSNADSSTIEEAYLAAIESARG
jgi:DNA-binding winged helix-turn-helix (wHTH) protein